MEYRINFNAVLGYCQNNSGENRVYIFFSNGKTLLLLHRNSTVSYVNE